MCLPAKYYFHKLLWEVLMKHVNYSGLGVSAETRALKWEVWNFTSPVFIRQGIFGACVLIILVVFGALISVRASSPNYSQDYCSVMWPYSIKDLTYYQNHHLYKNKNDYHNKNAIRCPFSCFDTNAILWLVSQYLTQT